MNAHLQRYFGFNKTPFSRSIAPSALHGHRSHREAVARIEWAIAERGLGLITGEVGSGKSVAIRAATATLDPSRHTVIYTLGNPATGTGGIYNTIIEHLGEKPKIGRARLIRQTMQILTAEETERGRTVVIIIDEAHLLTSQQLEEFRLLMNANMDSHTLFAGLLVGQPTLRKHVRLGTLAALDQRITTRSVIQGMSPEETKSYIKHHISLAGRSDELFSDDAILAIHQHSRGLPRGVNILSTMALTATLSAKGNIVDEKSARSAIAENSEE
jgi:type II secretory pathway predicted ATPase ExeA